jgi:hypothetical protein
MKQSKDRVNNQMPFQEKQDLVRVLKTTGINTLDFSVPLSPTSEFLRFGNHPKPQTVEAETQDWYELCWGQKLFTFDRGTFLEAEDIYGSGFDTKTPVGSSQSAKSDGKGPLSPLE